MSECKICKGFIGLNICLRCGSKQGAIAELKDELDWLNRSLEWAYVFAKGETQQIFQMRKDRIEKRLLEL